MMGLYAVTILFYWHATVATAKARSVIFCTGPRKHGESSCTDQSDHRHGGPCGDVFGVTGTVLRPCTSPRTARMARPLHNFG